MKQQQSYNQQSQNAGEAANFKTKAFQQGQKDAFNSTQNKTINGNDEKAVETQRNTTHQTSPHLHSELTIGKNTAWNQSDTNDGDVEQEELDKSIKRKPIFTEIESKETREKRIKQSLIGEVF
jgi:hypothetical protein